MCAIFGYSGFKDAELIKKMAEDQRFRGPDEFNHYSNEKVTIGNNRLSIIDVEKGNQPIISENNKFVIVYNGMIYNFKQIRNYLLEKKITFKSKSDTEVLLNAYMYWGDKCFNYFDGMWAVCIFDIEKDIIIISRDYLGQKPLYYFHSNEKFCFSSKSDSIFLSNALEKKVNKEALGQYLLYSHIPAPLSIYENIKQVKPGEIIKYDISEKKIIKQTFWDLTNGPDYNEFFKEKEDFQFIFEKKIKEFKTSDVGFGVLLSGGIDSYLISKFVSKFSEKKISTYTLGFDEKTFDESKYIKNFKEWDTNIFNLTDEEYHDNFLEIIKKIDEPIGDCSILPTYSLLKEINKKKKTKVIIGGDGGDENFFGYIIFDAYKIALVLKKILPKFFVNLINKLLNFLPSSKQYMSTSFKVKKFFEYLNFSENKLCQLWMSSLSPSEIKTLFNNKIDFEILIKESDELFKKHKDKMKSSQFYFFRFYLSSVLSKVDKASMFNSMEYRSPFLSKSIINFALDLKGNYSFLRKKIFLKKHFNKILPKTLKYRPKHGFAFPKSKIIFNEKILSKIDENLLLNKEFFYERLENYKNNKKDYGQYLWNEITLNFMLQNKFNL